MSLIAIIFVVLVFFFSTRYGVKSESKSVRIFSYFGIFLSIALLVCLTFVILSGSFQ